MKSRSGAFARTLPLGTLLFAILLLLTCVLPMRSAGAEDFLEPEAAFKFSAKMIAPDVAQVRFAIADGYYLYRERIKVDSEDGKLGAIDLPKGHVKFDETFQKEVETYRHELLIRVPVQSTGEFTLKIRAQGCADQGLCYPPMDSVIKLNASAAAPAHSTTTPGHQTDMTSPATPAAKVPATVAVAPAELTPAVQQPTASADSAAASVALPAVAVVAPAATEVSSATQNTQPDTPPDMQAASDAEGSSITRALNSGKLLLILPLFFLLGLGLSFTPCVLPMVPILSFIIVGEGVHLRRSRGFALSLSYALGMALVYTALGVAAGLLGEGLSATLQNPWVLGGFALLMVLLSLSMFNVYQLQVPAALQTRLTSFSEGQRNGKLIGVFLMGAISALIVGPCVAAPLAGALVYISQTRDVIVGGSALFSMAMGMSVPLLLVGVSAGSLLPRAGVWMESIKRFFGVLMLAMALWMVSPVIPVWTQMLAWALLLLAYGGYLLRYQRSGMFARVAAVLLILLGATQAIGVATGGRDVYAPLAHLYGKPDTKVEFARVRSVAELDQALARADGKVAILDFYADWCVSCKEMEKLTFTDERVKRKLANVLLLQIDVTANNEDDKAMLKRFNLFGPPGIIFFNKQAQEIQGGRVIGYQNAEKFLQSLTVLGV